MDGEITGREKNKNKGRIKERSCGRKLLVKIENIKRANERKGRSQEETPVG